jgi:eukaryotic-like serine/threonine-protein kinase
VKVSSGPPRPPGRREAAGGKLPAGPHNVILRRDGVAKLTDFGIARAMEDSGLTEIGTVLGTAPFMAPEQAAGRPVGPPADVYALGALLRQLSAGPLPAPLAGLVDAALAHDPAARPTAADFPAALDGFAAPAVPGPRVVTAAAAAPAGGVDDSAPPEIPNDGGPAVLPRPAGCTPPGRYPRAGAARDLATWLRAQGRERRLPNQASR